MGNYNISMVQGRTWSYAGQITVNGSGVDITSDHIKFVAKYSLTDPDADAVFLITDPTNIAYTTPATGQFTVTIPSTATASLPQRDEDIDLEYELVYLPANGKKWTLLKGSLIVEPRGYDA